MSTTTVRQNKDANATLDYVFDWEAFVDADVDTIASADVIAPAGLTVTGTTITTSTVRVFVAGGVEGTTYPIVNRIATAGGRREDKVLELTITQSPSVSHSFVVETGSASATANSYASVANGDTYHASHLYASVWTQKTDAVKETALMWATRLLDEQIAWAGHKLEDAQALQWPRNGVLDRGDFLLSSTAIPKVIKDAVSELARYLLTSDRTAESDTIGFKKIKAGPVEIEIDKADRESLKQIIPRHIIEMVWPLGAARRGQTKLKRT